MSIRVSYTQRGFTNRHEYEVNAWDEVNNCFFPTKLVNTTITCKACQTKDLGYSIANIEGRDLVNDPYICTEPGCGSKNIHIRYFKPNILPLIFYDDNHKNTSMYNNYIEDFNNGLIHSGFKPIIDMLQHPDFYYGASNHATYVDPEQPMMGGTVKNAQGISKKWKEFPWVDITMFPNAFRDLADPALVLTPLNEETPIPSQAFINAYGVKVVGSTTQLEIPYQIPYSVLDNNFVTGPQKVLEKTVRTETIMISQVGVPGTSGYVAAHPEYKVYWTLRVLTKSIWDWNNLSEATRTAVMKWQEKTNSTWERFQIAVPEWTKIIGVEQYIGTYANISLAAWNSTHILKDVTVGLIFEGLPATTLTLTEESDLCDCKYSIDPPLLPGVPDELEFGFDLPPIPLYVNPASGAGSTNTLPADPPLPQREPTNYTSTRIAEIRSDFPLIETTDIEKLEGSKFLRVQIPGHKHIWINRFLPTGKDCSPCLEFNDHMFSCIVYIINQVDLDDPLY